MNGILSTSKTIFALVSLSLHFSQITAFSQTETVKLKAERKKLSEILISLPDSAFVDLTSFTRLFVFDMKYATNENFLKDKVYDCPTCVVRVETAKGLVKAEKLLRTKGYQIKFFDCYRPLSIQKRMWEILPDRRYVADPTMSGSGSNHNRGAAIDITLCDLAGKELDMGTVFDHFGEEAHLAYSKFPKSILKNRHILKTAMQKAGFVPQDSEWWHFSLGTPKKYPLADTPVKCN